MARIEIAVTLLILLIGFANAYTDRQATGSLLANSTTTNYNLVTLGNNEWVQDSSFTRINQSWISNNGVSNNGVTVNSVWLGNETSFSYWEYLNNVKQHTGLDFGFSYSSSGGGICTRPRSNGNYSFYLANINYNIFNYTNDGVGKWMHYVFVVNDTEMKTYFYKNGVLNQTLSTRTANFTLRGTAGEWKILDENANEMNGSLDEIRIYNRSLTSSEVLQIYNSGRTANASLPSNSLVRWYSFNEINGTTIYDLSTYNRTSTISNANITFGNDNANITLVRGTDINSTNGVFNIINENLKYTQINYTYNIRKGVNQYSIKDSWFVFTDAFTLLIALAGVITMLLIIGIGYMTAYKGMPAKTAMRCIMAVLIMAFITGIIITWMT